MSKKSSFRGSSNMWHGKRAETLSKSGQQHLYHIYWSLWKQFSWKKSLLVIFKILGLFLNPLSADDKYYLLKRGNLLQHFQIQLSRKRNILSQFFFLNFRNLDSILNIFRKKMIFIADVFLNLRTPKNVVRKKSKKVPFRGPFDK